MKRWLLSILVVLVTLHSRAQDKHVIDELYARFEQKYDRRLAEEILDSCGDIVHESELKGASENKVKAYVLKCYSAYLYSHNNIPEAIFYGERAVEAAEKCGDMNLLSAASGYVGAAHLYLGNYGKGAEMFMKCYDINMKMNSVKIAVRYLHNIANAFQLQKDYDNALRYAGRSLELIDKINDYPLPDKARTLGLVASILLSRGDKSEKDDSLRAEKDYLKGLDYVRKACDIDSSLNSGNIFGYLCTKASCLQKLHKEKEGNIIFQYLADTLKNLPQYVQLYSIVLYHLDRYDETYEISKKIDYKDMEYNSLIRLIQKEKNVDSIHRKFEDYIALVDNIWMQENAQSTARCDALFRMKEKESELADMQVRSAKENERYKLILAISVFLLVASVGAIAALVRDRRRRRQLIILNDKLLNNVQLLKKTNSVKDELIRVISHDLSGMVANVNMLSHMQKENPSEQGGDMLVEQSDILKGLLDNLLIWARIQKSGTIVVKKTKVSLNEVVEDVIKINSLTACQKGVMLKYECDEGMCVVETDRNLLHCIVRNLVSNAIKFTPSGGMVTVFFDKEHVCVYDTGKGMTDEMIEKVYNGNTVHTEGTNGEPGSGLGLSIVRAMIQMCGAKFEIESSQGKGSAFTVKFS